MRTVPCTLLAAMTLVLAGCVDLLSVHPLATPETAVFDANLIGEWAHSDDDGITVAWIRPGSPAAKDYDIVWIPAKPDELPLRLNGRLVKVGGRLIFDLVTTERPDMSVPGHFFMLVEKRADELKLHWLDSEWLRNQVVQPGGPAHLMLDSKPVITAGSQAVAAFLEKYSLDPKAISDSITLKRVKGV
ncbi:MAG TPA: hypothetical protein PLZ95_10270 [Bryobacteraceae bacterium]|nr:hypothetical protein [Bryobacteraceae bacterium]